MSTRTLTPQQRENVLYAIEQWKNVDPATVVQNLNTWREDECHHELEDGREMEPPTCGTPACFGGHIPYMPRFREMGVVPRRASGAPTTTDAAAPALYWNLGWRLFGTSEIFDAVTYREARRILTKELLEDFSNDEYVLTQQETWQVVMNRLTDLSQVPVAEPEPVVK